MSVNASQLELNQLIYRHLKEHGFLSAAEELQRHSPQGESNPSISLLDIYKSWLKDTKKKRCPKSKLREGRTPSKAKTASPRKKMNKPPEIPASPKKSVPVKRRKNDEKPSQSVKAKKSKPNTTEKAAGDGSDSDSSLDIEKWKKLLDQLTEADVAKMETINALASESQPKKTRVRKPRAKPLSKTDALIQQNGETIGQNEQGTEKVGTQTPAKKNAAKGSKIENPAPVSSPSKQSPNKRAKSVEDEQASSKLPEKFEKQAQLQETLVPVDAKDELGHETKKKKKKKKKEKEENEDKTEGSANETNSDGKDGKQKKGSEITEQEDAGKTEGAKRTTKEGKREERGSDDEKISELSLQKKKAKKKEKDKSSSEEGLAQIDVKMMVIGEENSKQPDEKIKSGTPKPKKKEENNNMEGNLEYTSVGEEESGEQNIEEMENSKEMVTKEKTSCEKYSAEIHKKKKKKKKVLYNEGNSELLEEDLKANPEQIISTDEAGGNKKCEQNDQGKKAKKKKDKSFMKGNVEQEIMAVEENVEDEYNSEQMSGKKKSKKKKKRESLGCKEFPEEVAQEKKAKKNEKSDENDLVKEEKPEDDDDANKKSTLETDEGSLEITSPLKKKKKKNKLKSDEAPEEAEISTQNASTTQSNSADVHKKKKKSKRTES